MASRNHNSFQSEVQVYFNALQIFIQKEEMAYSRVGQSKCKNVISCCFLCVFPNEGKTHHSAVAIMRFSLLKRRMYFHANSKVRSPFFPSFFFLSSLCSIFIHIVDLICDSVKYEKGMVAVCSVNVYGHSRYKGPG